MSTAASSSTSSTEPHALAAGRVGRAHGLDGSFYATGPIPGLLGLGRTLLVAGRPRVIERRAGTDAKPILRLAGCRTRDAVEALRGESLLVEHADLPSLGDGEYWPHQLEGCRVVDGDVEVGVVRRMIFLPSCEALEVGDRLIPLVSDAVRSIDLAARRVEVDLAFLGE